ncbi:MAG: MBL fold metallo-hydrolase [Clostridia bacterium]|nr:MBL fold metallo-hydrolase [Clostridia bacterium]
MKMYTRCLTLALLFCGMLPFGSCSAKAAKIDVKLYCLNIGKADCMILCCADKVYLIDAGYAHTYPALETALAALKIDHLNGVFLTHCHEDHMGGMMPLAESNIAIDHFYAASIYHDVKEKKHPMIRAAKKRNMEVEWLSSGNSVPIADGYSFQILGPLQTNEENENNNSLVIRFSSPHGSILFAGDMKDEEENELLYHNRLQPCDVLKVGHHGDDGATSKAFLSTVQPKCAVIMTHSRQEPDTPAPQVLFRLSNVGCDTYITQNAQDAYCITLRNGSVSVQDIAWPHIPKRTENIGLIADTEKNTLTLTNKNSHTIHLTGCTLYLAEKDEVVSLKDLSLDAGASFILGGKKAGNDVHLKLDIKKIMDDKKLDVAILYDQYGRILAICNNGQDE